jgi:NitT/TauT family transport system ATP-binding protein
MGNRRETVLIVASEIDEAIFLADKILIMSNRPAHIKHRIEVDLTRPKPRYEAGAS